jgi:hypothetical protein
MGFDLTAGVLVFVAVVIWRMARRGTLTNLGPLPDVGDAPASADPVFVWRYEDDGFTRYPAAVAEAGPRDGDAG